MVKYDGIMYGENGARQAASSLSASQLRQGVNKWSSGGYFGWLTHACS